MKQLIAGMIRAARLDSGLYGEISQQPEQISQAVKVVVISSIAAGIGSVGHIGITGIVVGSVGALIAWFIWAYIVYVLGAKIKPVSEVSLSQGEFLRCAGFSSAPGVIRVLGIIPPLYYFASFIGNAWMIICMAAAVRQVFGYDKFSKAVKVCAFGWLLMLGATIILSWSCKGIGF